MHYSTMIRIMLVFYPQFQKFKPQKRHLGEKGKQQTMLVLDFSNNPFDLKVLSAKRKFLNELAFTSNRGRSAYRFNDNRNAYTRCLLPD